MHDKKCDSATELMEHSSQESRFQKVGISGTNCIVGNGLPELFCAHDYHDSDDQMLLSIQPKSKNIANTKPKVVIVQHNRRDRLRFFMSLFQNTDPSPNYNLP